MQDSGDHRLSRRSTIMGPAGLTAVFGMGTGVTPPVWSPENRPRGGQTAEAALARWLVTAANQEGKWQMPNDRFPRSHHTRSGTSATNSTRTLGQMPFVICHLPSDRFGESTAIVVRLAALSGEPIGVVKLLGC